MIKTQYEPIKAVSLKRKKMYIQMAQKCALFLSHNYGVKRVYLIGSLVHGIFHDRSDIDLVVEGLPAKLYIKALTDLYNLLLPGVELNLIPYEDAFESLKASTLSNGKLIYMWRYRKCC